MNHKTFVKNRRIARKLVLQVLYEVDCSDHDWEQAMSRQSSNLKLSQDASEFARSILQGVSSEKDHIDDIIAEFAPTWPVSQMGLIDRSLLRMAVCELELDSGSQEKIVINETIELAKEFGSENSYRLVNGVLGSIWDKAKGQQTIKGNYKVTSGG